MLRGKLLFGLVRFKSHEVQFRSTLSQPIFGQPIFGAIHLSWKTKQLWKKKLGQKWFGLGQFRYLIHF